MKGNEYFMFILLQVVSNCKHLYKVFFSRFSSLFKRCIAFTLAETLIVMGIIGVVAALTIPNLNSSTANTEKVTKLKKLYAEVSQAHDRAIAVYGPIGTWFVGMTESDANKRYIGRISEFLKTTKITDDSITLASGAKMYCYLYYYEGNNLSKYTGKPLYGSIYVKLDNKPILFGINYFDFSITSEGIIPNGFASADDMQAAGLSGSLISGYLNSIGSDFDKATYIYDVTWWVINMGNMDYLKCGNDLNWTTKTTCK